MGWDPTLGTHRLINRLGHERAIEILVRLLVEPDLSYELAQPPYRDALIDIGNGTAGQLLSDVSGQRLAYWPAYGRPDRWPTSATPAWGARCWKRRPTNTGEYG